MGGRERCAAEKTIRAEFKEMSVRLSVRPEHRRGDINALSYELRQIEINATYFQAPRPEAKQNNCVYFGD